MMLCIMLMKKDLRILGIRYGPPISSLSEGHIRCSDAPCPDSHIITFLDIISTACLVDEVQRPFLILTIQFVKKSNSCTTKTKQAQHATIVPNT